MICCWRAIRGGPEERCHGGKIITLSPTCAGAQMVPKARIVNWLVGASPPIPMIGVATSPRRPESPITCRRQV